VSDCSIQHSKTPRPILANDCRRQDLGFLSHAEASAFNSKSRKLGESDRLLLMAKLSCWLRSTLQGRHHDFCHFPANFFCQLAPLDFLRLRFPPARPIGPSTMRPDRAMPQSANNSCKSACGQAPAEEPTIVQRAHHFVTAVHNDRRDVASWGNRARFDRAQETTDS